MIRIGQGFDTHALGSDGPLIIGGIRIPYPKRLLAYSDGDVLLHAVIDALLGAASLGDIGQLFPDTDPSFKDIDSRFLLRQAYEYIQKKCYSINNLDASIIAQEPKIGPYILQMRINISEDLKCDKDKINVKATTTEKLGFTGRGEGIACAVTVLLIKS